MACSFYQVALDHVLYKCVKLVLPYHFRALVLLSTAQANEHFCFNRRIFSFQAKKCDLYKIGLDRLVPRNRWTL